MKLVLDTNVLLSAILVPDTCRELLKGRALAHEWFTSPALLEELAAKLQDKPKLVPEHTPLYLVYRRRTRLVTPVPLPSRVCRDPDDDVVLATAIAAQAQVIVTGDNDLLSLRKYESMAILSPRRFLEMLDRKA